MNTLTKMIPFALMAVLSTLSTMHNVDAFSVSHANNPASCASSSLHATYMSTVAPTREKTDRKIRKGGNDDNNNNEDERSNDPDDIVRYNDAPMEYLEDEWSTREPDDPFHILLLDTTFTENERVTVSYIAGSVTYVLGMPEDEARELTQMAADNGFSCLGTWEREECLKLGKQLQIRDCVVRVVPYCQGGARGWQMKDASSGSDAGYGGFEGGADFSRSGSGGSFFD